MFARGQTSYFGSGASPNGPKPETQTAQSGSGVLRDGQPASSPPASGSGERCQLPQRSPGRAPTAKRFSCILDAPVSFFWNERSLRVSVSNSGVASNLWEGAASLRCFLDSLMRPFLDRLRPSSASAFGFQFPFPPWAVLTFLQAALLPQTDRATIMQVLRINQSYKCEKSIICWNMMYFRHCRRCTLYAACRPMSFRAGET